MQEPKYVGYVACAVAAPGVAPPVLVWCQTVNLISISCSAVALAG